MGLISHTAQTPPMHATSHTRMCVSELYGSLWGSCVYVSELQGSLWDSDTYNISLDVYSIRLVRSL